MTRQEALTATLVVVTVAAGISAQRAARGVGEATPDAVAWHGAMNLYRNLAVFFGKQALRAEAAYWKAVQQ